MPTVTLDLPDVVIDGSGGSPQELARAVCVAAAVHWYSRGELSQGKAAEVAGMTRAQFIQELARQRVDVFQVDAADAAPAPHGDARG